MCVQPEKAGSSAVKEMAGGDGSELPGHDLTPAAAASVTAAKCYVHLAQMQVRAQDNLSIKMHSAAAGMVLWCSEELFEAPKSKT